MSSEAETETSPPSFERTVSRSPIAHLPQRPYHPHDVLDETFKTGMIGFGGGFFIAAVQNALSQRNLGVMGAFTRGAPVMGLAAAAPAAYAFFSRTTMNLREKEDGWGAAVGGFAAGGVLGLPYRRTPIVVGLGAVFAISMGTLHFFGDRLDSFKEEGDEFERKEIIRRTTRRPIEETIAEIGEGRGIRPHGYEDRRRERIKDKYGFEINPVSATTEGSS